VKDGNKDHITREPEQVKAFRDTWRDGIHSYLTYLRDRLTVACDLLADSGSIFVQIGDENVHRVRALMDEVFGDKNIISLIPFIKTTSQSADFLPNVADYVLCYAKDLDRLKYRQIYTRKTVGGEGSSGYSRIQKDSFDRRAMLADEKRKADTFPPNVKVFTLDNLTSQRPPGDFPLQINGRTIRPHRGYWKTGEIGMARLQRAMRVETCRKHSQVRAVYR
jgi:adenine-specific DNA-methyltransferase